MSVREEVFRFSMIRPPEATTISDRTPVIRIPKVAEAEEAKTTYRILERQLENISYGCVDGAAGLNSCKKPLPDKAA